MADPTLQRGPFPTFTFPEGAGGSKFPVYGCNDPEETRRTIVAMQKADKQPQVVLIGSEDKSHTLDDIGAMTTIKGSWLVLTPCNIYLNNDTSHCVAILVVVAGDEGKNIPFRSFHFIEASSPPVLATLQAQNLIRVPPEIIDPSQPRHSSIWRWLEQGFQYEVKQLPNHELEAWGYTRSS